MGAVGVLKEVLRPAWHAAKAACGAISNSCKWAYGRKLAAKSGIEPRKVVLSCNFGRGYLCNPKYIAEALERLYPGEFDLVLLVRKRDESLPAYLRQVRYGSRAAQRELVSARFWIYNFRDCRFVPKKDNQILIQAWHACLGAKRCERDVEETLGESYVRLAKADGGETDLMVSDNRLTASVYQKSFWFTGPVFRAGTPRNRPLILGDTSKRDTVRRTLGVPSDMQLCLYAPTFRSDYSFEWYRFDYEGVCSALFERFGKNFVLAYRLHPNMATRERPSFLDDLIDATDYPDQQELLAATDVLISDHSSIMDDWCLTGRAGFVFAPDFDEFNQDRGLYYSLDTRPFPVAADSDGLVEAVLNFDPDGLSRRTTEFLSMVGLDDDGRGDEEVARVIYALAENPNKGITEVLGEADIWPRSL